jgi:hypothetical protein
MVVAVPSAMVLCLAGCGAGNEAVKGSMEIDDFQGNCLTDPGFSDITDGTQAVIKSPSGSVIGTGSLSYASKISSMESSLQPGMSVCIYTFKATVPAGESRYGITVANRGTVWFSPRQMAKGPGLSVSSGGSGL